MNCSRCGTPMGLYHDGAYCGLCSMTIKNHSNRSAATEAEIREHRAALRRLDTLLPIHGSVPSWR